ncbi:hypothetical protein D9757_006682 [Collybiopsis confluens]|uniref:Uncharacterized protein n=1 Tax=Collybiopsis confluens TaxID=2823264 RepID=A0A8H5HN65_9AGAR|nr:hypothetical protein D9757_006682 [Collybiopsis confluens]
MPPFTSQPVDTTRISTYFSSFPVRTCDHDSEAVSTIEHALQSTISSCTASGSSERKRAKYRHSNPAGNLFGLCLTMCEADRVGHVAKFTEFLCIVDDVMEDLPFGEASIEHAILRQALYERYDSDSYAGQVVGDMKAFLREMRKELVAQNDPESLRLLQTLDTSLHNRDSVDDEFRTLEDYIPFRKTNFDYEFVCQLLRWAMKVPLKLEAEEERLARQYEHLIGVIVGLTNDFFSWEMEREQLETCDRIRNAVPVLMVEHSVSEAEAKAMLKEVILREERRASDLRAKVEVSGSERLKKWVEAMELFAAGYSFWCATCPRYNRPQNEQH